MSDVPVFMVEVCAYCGAPGSDREHVVPKSSENPTYLVWACRECNPLASNDMWPTFGEKAAEIGRRLRRRHAKLLRMPDWSKSELEELGPTLAAIVRRDLRRRDEVIERLGFNKTVVRKNH